MTMKNETLRDLLYMVLFIALFFVIQALVQYAAVGIYALGKGANYMATLKAMSAGDLGQLTAVSVVFSSLITIALFTTAKWSPVSRSYLRSKPWWVLFWAVFLALGTILPTEFIYERIQLTMPEQQTHLFNGIMKEPWGYAAIGLFVPVAEELVFRGGVLRKLLEISGQRKHWIAILVSAAIFGLLHFNLAQGVHGFIIGLILGWMYYRTRSVIPGIAFHWVNNSVAYAMFNLMPQMQDGMFTNMFHTADHKLMIWGLVCSVFILVPSILQLYIKMKPADAKK